MLAGEGTEDEGPDEGDESEEGENRQPDIQTHEQGPLSPPQGLGGVPLLRRQLK